jgi:hypothetical protein
MHSLKAHASLTEVRQRSRSRICRSQSTFLQQHADGIVCVSDPDASRPSDDPQSQRHRDRLEALGLGAPQSGLASLMSRNQFANFERDL